MRGGRQKLAGRFVVKRGVERGHSGTRETRREGKGSQPPWRAMRDIPSFGSLVIRHLGCAWREKSVGPMGFSARRRKGDPGCSRDRGPRTASWTEAPWHAWKKAGIGGAWLQQILRTGRWHIVMEAEALLRRRPRFVPNSKGRKPSPRLTGHGPPTPDPRRLSARGRAALAQMGECGRQDAPLAPCISPTPLLQLQPRRKAIGPLLQRAIGQAWDVFCRHFPWRFPGLRHWQPPAASGTDCRSSTSDCFRTPTPTYGPGKLFAATARPGLSLHHHQW